MNALKQTWAAIKWLANGYWELCVVYAWWAFWHAPSKSESAVGFGLMIIPPFLTAMFFIMTFTEPMP